MGHLAYPLKKTGVKDHELIGLLQAVLKEDQEEMWLRMAFLAKKFHTGGGRGSDQPESDGEGLANILGSPGNRCLIIQTLFHALDTHSTVFHQCEDCNVKIAALKSLVSRLSSSWQQ
jgi:hypothetical protein